MRIKPAIFEMQGSMLTTVPRPFLPNQNTMFSYSRIYCALLDASLGNFHESSKTDHTPQVSARYRHCFLTSVLWFYDWALLWAISVNVFRWSLYIIVRDLATFTEKTFGNFTQYLSLPGVEMLSVLEIHVIWSCKRCFGKQKTPCDKSVPESKSAAAAEMVHFWTAPLCEFPIGSRYICHTDAINISNTNNLKKILWKYSIQTLKTADSVWCLFMRGNGRCDIPHSA